MNIQIREKIRSKIGKLRNERFENFVNDIIRKEYFRFGTLETMVNKDGNQRKSKPDAHIQIASEEFLGKYIIFNHTIEGEHKIVIDIEKTCKGIIPITSIYKYVTCTNNPVGERREEYANLTRNLGWEYEIYSLDKLTDLAIKYRDILKRHLNLEYENEAELKLYDCGHRLKVIRLERNLTCSQLIELTSINSEKEIIQLEENISQCSNVLINEIVELTGASVDWIKHGKGNKYNPINLSKILKHSNFELLELDLKPELVLLCLEPVHMGLVFLFQFSDYKIGFNQYRHNLDFWNWFDGQHQIPEIFQDLKFIFEKFGICCDSRLISEEDYSLIVSGTCFPKAIVDSDKGKCWIEDLIWYEEDYLKQYDRKSFYNQYEWFLKLKEGFLHYHISREKENNYS